MPEVKAEVTYNPATRTWDIYLARETGDERGVELAMPVELEFCSHPAGKYAEPTLRLSKRLAESLVRGLSGAGIRSERDSRIEGSLEATKQHLEDLRELLGLGHTGRSRRVEIEG